MHVAAPRARSQAAVDETAGEYKIRRMQRPAMLSAAVFLTTAVLAAPGWAADQPLLTPSRDVGIDYTIDQAPARQALPGLQPGDRVHLSVKADATKLRLDGQGLPGYLLLDRGAAHMLLVMPAQKMFVQMDADPAAIALFLQPDRLHFTRKGTDTVARLACATWSVQDGARSSTGCLTADGVLLRGSTTERGTTGAVTATSVTYGPLAENLFEPPPGYHRLDLPPGLIPGLMAPGPARPRPPHS